ncbi:MAG: hypothetical protein FJ315_04480, partial [SAR202 cluster bacterium]|nr:hypothetical protein [SAR202 cluster bacterium]
MTCTTGYRNCVRLVNPPLRFLLLGRRLLIMSPTFLPAVPPYPQRGWAVGDISRRRHPVPDDLPLPPYRVLDLTLEEGHLCGRMLADLGADVLKVEPPGGDQARKRGPFYQGVDHPERSFHFWFYNLNKRGVTLDLTRPEGRDLLRRLIRSADVLVESYPPGFLDSLGLGNGAFRDLNPKLVHTSI